MKKNKPQPTGIDLLIDICNKPNKYARFVNVPSWQDAARYLIEMGYQLTLKQRPIIMRRELSVNWTRSIASEAQREMNMN
jgi:hypothetical protein